MSKKTATTLERAKRAAESICTGSCFYDFKCGYTDKSKNPIPPIRKLQGECPLKKYHVNHEKAENQPLHPQVSGADLLCICVNCEHSIHLKDSELVISNETYERFCVNCPVQAAKENMLTD